MKKNIRGINKKYLLMIKKILERKRRSILDNYLTSNEKKLLFQIEDECKYFNRKNYKVKKWMVNL